ncbi:MAG: hypothetical protein K8F24_10480, partial [Bacteroidales bacterium]|nr:hypothetical protein [Bacteroidales bacterium]
SLYIQFEQYYRNLSGSDIGTVEVYDGSAWVTAATYQGQSYGSWTASDLQNIDVTAYKNDNFQVRFRYIAHNDWYWAIDNVKITNAAAPLRVPVIGKGLEHNKVFLDGQLITETTDSEYQYDVSMLTPYETYTAGVIAVYATGVSPMMEFDFIYVPCGDYDVPTAFAAAQVEGTLDIMLEWTNVDAAALDTVSALRIYRNGEEYAELNFEDAAVETYLDANLDFGMYTYCVTYIYDSGAETCQGLTCSDEVEIDGNAGVDGMVMQAAYLGGDPI